MNSYYNKGVELSARTTVHRRAGAASYDRAVIDAILDEGLVGHLGLCDREGQPFVIPIAYARAGDEVLLHGSVLSRLLGTLAAGLPVCFTVTLLDGLVLARSAFHHSMNYRSVVILGEARPIRGTAAKLAALEAIVAHVAPGRAAEIRGPSPQELAATEVATLAIQEASAKVRSGFRTDAPEDYELACWAGQVPLSLRAGDPITDPRCPAPPPSYLAPYRRGDDPPIAA
jgi:nitroimidazol reductase NimA-like FMN-containing flavoprotein (pyridoxamine 5'-phosphate oxidase superfamily)